MDPPNVFWFFGAYVIEVGVYALIETIPKSQDGLWWIFVTAVGLFVAFVLLAAGLLRRWWWVPGGLAAALAVGDVPCGRGGFLAIDRRLAEPVVPGPFSDFSGYWFGVALATAAVGLLAFALTRFPFILGVSIASSSPRRNCSCPASSRTAATTARQWLGGRITAGDRRDLPRRVRPPSRGVLVPRARLAHRRRRAGLVHRRFERRHRPRLAADADRRAGAPRQRRADSPGDMGGLRSARLLRSRRALPEKGSTRSLAFRAAAPVLGLSIFASGCSRTATATRGRDASCAAHRQRSVPNGTSLFGQHQDSSSL